MANLTERQLELMGLEEYEPGKYRKKVAVVNELPIEIQKQDAIFKSRNDPSPYKDTWAMKTMVPVKNDDGSTVWKYPEDVPEINESIIFKELTPESFDGPEVKGFDLDDEKESSSKFNEEVEKVLPYYEVRHPELIQEMLDVKESPEVVMKRFQEQGIIFHNSQTSGKVFEVTVNNFTEEITIAQSQRAKPYIKGKKTPKLPQKYMTDEYGWDEKDRLIHKGSGEIIPSNPTKVGQPRMWRVNGQALYNSYLTDQQRNTYMTKLSEYLFPYFTDQAYITAKHLKLKVDFYLMDRGSKNIDNDNRWIWIKAIRDVMKKTILPEDSPYIIYGDEFNTYFTPIESETRMVVTLWANT